MPLSVGDRLGPYEIVAPIGAGGMGEVYKARDTRLDRVVAIKVAREQFSERFEREARAVAALNHPHICQLYDVGPNYLVMEFVEGTPLQGPLPVEKAVEYAGQILDALDAAHRKGITHRDLKPANILVTKQGIKLLDFGLAKQRAPLTEADATLTAALTSKGQILGTLQYMSPEQLHGQEADPRSDLFSFGCVLYEMLSGKRAFEGQSAASVIAAILEREPAPMDVAPPVDRVVKRCLAKDPDARFQNARDLKTALTWATEQPPTSTATRPSRHWWIPATAALILGAVGTWSVMRFRETPPPTTAVRFQILAPEKTTMADGVPALSPDGRRLAFRASGADGHSRIWVRALDSLDAHALPGTDDASLPGPFWSPDSRFLGFHASGKLKKADVAGGPPVTLCDTVALLGGAWSRDGVIFFGSPRGIFRVPQAGGVPAQLTTVEPKELLHGHPYFLPDGRHFLLTNSASIFVATLDGKDKKRIVEVGARAEYAPGSSRGEPGHLVFLREGTLMAQPLDGRTFDVTGEAFPVAEQVASAFGGRVGFFSVSANGTLAYRTGAGAGRSRLVRFDREGKSLGTLGPPGQYEGLALSRDGKRVAVSLVDPQSWSPAVWVLEVAQGAPSRLAFNPLQDEDPVWSPDGSRLAFSSARGPSFAAFAYQVYLKDSSGVGSEELVVKAGRIRDWSSNGQFLLYETRDPRTGLDLWVLPLDQKVGDRKPMAYLHESFNEIQGQFAPGPEGSPAGAPRWVAYTSNESGQNEIYVQSFPPGAGKFLISNGGGMEPRWRRDGKELFYVGPGGNLMAVDVKTAPTFEHGLPKALFQTRITNVLTPVLPFRYDVTADGKGFLINTRAQLEEAPSTPITVVLNWTAGLKK